jgi:hypothetical protein
MTQDKFFGADTAMKWALTGSFVFHIVIFVLATVGLPQFMKDHEPEPINPISVEFVSPEEAAAEKKEEPPKKAPQKQEEKPTPPPQMTEDAPPDLSKQDMPEIEEEAPPEEAETVPLPDEVKEKPPIKPPPPRPEITRKAPAKPQKDFASLLKNLTPDLDTERQQEFEDISAPETSDVSNIDLHLTRGEIDALRRQLAGCWNVLAGAKYAEDLAVEIQLTINPDMTVKTAAINSKSRYNNDAHYRAAADAALRALRQPGCSKLNLPADKFEQWKTTIIRFDPRDML